MSNKCVLYECPQECPTRRSYRSVLQEGPTCTVPHEGVPQECWTKVSYKCFLQGFSTRVSYESVPQECPARVSHKSIHKKVGQECSASVPHKSAPTRVSHKSVRQECLREYNSDVYKSVPVSHKSILQECFARVSRERECHTRAWDVPQECPARVSYKSVSQECPTRCPSRVRKSAPQKISKENVSHKRVPQECLLQECQTLFGCLFFEDVFAFGFVGYILFLMLLAGNVEKLWLVDGCCGCGL